LKRVGAAEVYVEIGLVYLILTILFVLGLLLVTSRMG
jgi:hypothetical protein